MRARGNKDVVGKYRETQNMKFQRYLTLLIMHYGVHIIISFPIPVCSGSRVTSTLKVNDFRHAQMRVTVPKRALTGNMLFRPYINERSCICNPISFINACNLAYKLSFKNFKSFVFCFFGGY